MRGKILLYQLKYRWQSLSIFGCFLCKMTLFRYQKIIYDTGVHQMRSFFYTICSSEQQEALQIITHLLRYAKNSIFYLNML